MEGGRHRSAQSTIPTQAHATWTTKAMTTRILDDSSGSSAPVHKPSLITVDSESSVESVRYKDALFDEKPSPAATAPSSPLTSPDISQSEANAYHASPTPVARREGKKTTSGTEGRLIYFNNLHDTLGSAEQLSKLNARAVKDPKAPRESTTRQPQTRYNLRSSARAPRRPPSSTVNIGDDLDTEETHLTANELVTKSSNLRDKLPIRSKFPAVDDSPADLPPKSQSCTKAGLKRPGRPKKKRQVERGAEECHCYLANCSEIT